MSSVPRTLPPSLIRAAPALLVVVVVALVVASHVSAVHRCLVPAHGFLGAEYIEHAQRDALTERLVAYPLPLRIVRLPLFLAEADDTYPALLHVLAALWGSVLGSGIATTLHLNLVYLLALAAVVALATKRFAALLGPAPGGGWSCALAASTAILVPAVFGASRRYYYDFPMAVWVALALLALSYAPWSALAAFLAGLATAGALLTKWTAGFYLLPLWVFATVLAVRECSRQRRLAPLRNIVAAGLFVVVLCSPVLLRSWTLQTAAPGLFRVIGMEVGPTTVRQTNSFDCALGQAVVPEGEVAIPAPAPAGIGQRIAFYADGIPQAVLGPMLTAALLGICLVGWRGRRTLAVTAGICAPAMVVFVSPLIEPLDERFVLPLVPLALIGAFAAWEQCPSRVLRIASGAVVVAAGLIQIASWDGRIGLGPGWTGRSSWEERGWNRLDRTACSPFDEYVALAEHACGAGDRDLVISERVLEHVAIRWLLVRRCGSLEESIHSERQVTSTLLGLATTPPARPLAVIGSQEAPDVMALRPARVVGLSRSELVGSASAYLYLVDPVERPRDPGPSAAGDASP